VSAAARTFEVGGDYRHVAKVVHPGPRLSLVGTTLKWYEIAPADAPVPRDIRELARSHLRSAGARALGLRHELGFVILHRCGSAFYFLLVATWRNDNELWETVWAKDGDDDPAFRPWPIDLPHHPTFCVWELGAVGFEQRAWSDFLRSRRDGAARRAYLSRVFEGKVC
jgi:hypothetical protein